MPSISFAEGFLSGFYEVSFGFFEVLFSVLLGFYA